MRTKLSDWNNGWYGLELLLKPNEIDRVISLLQMIRADHNQHFHLSSDYEGESGLGDIEISIQMPDEEDNMIIFGAAIEPNDGNKA